MAPVNLSQFTGVRLLILQNVSARNWPRFFPNPIENLKVYVRSKDREEVFLKALSLENVQKLEFRSNFLHFRPCSKILSKPSNIQHLIFNSHRCSIDYEFLVKNLPDLRSIRSTNTYYPHRFNTVSGQFNNLQTIVMHCRHIDIEAMIYFLSEIALKSLRRCEFVNIESSLSGIANLLIS